MRPSHLLRNSLSASLLVNEFRFKEGGMPFLPHQRSWEKELLYIVQSAHCNSNSKRWSKSVHMHTERTFSIQSRLLSTLISQDSKVVALSAEKCAQSGRRKKQRQSLCVSLYRLVLFLLQSENWSVRKSWADQMSSSCFKWEIKRGLRIGRLVRRQSYESAMAIQQMWVAYPFTSLKVGRKGLIKSWAIHRKHRIVGPMFGDHRK